MVHRNNLLLSRLDPPSLARMIPYMKVLQLEQGKILAEAHRPVLKVYFPHGGIISSVVELIGGEAIETAMVGRDGVFGASQGQAVPQPCRDPGALASPQSLNRPVYANWPCKSCLAKASC
jgi:hypothetical protein